MGYLRFVLRFGRPQIQRTTTSVNQFITTLNTTINGGRKHVTESKKTDAGKVLRNKQGDEEYRYNDIAIPSQADTIRNLHPFPISPFPGTNEHLSGLTQTLLRKRLEPTEEKWVEDRLAKALEFAYVPPEWGIEPRKPAEKEAKDSDTESGDIEPNDDDKPKTAFEKFNKRSKGTLTENELVKKWNKAHRKFFGQPGRHLVREMMTLRARKVRRKKKRRRKSSRTLWTKMSRRKQRRKRQSQRRHRRSS